MYALQDGNMDKTSFRGSRVLVVVDICCLCCFNVTTLVRKEKFTLVIAATVVVQL